MRIGELAVRTGLTRDTIRFYERSGLVHSNGPIDATNDYRDYPEESVERLQMIVEARGAGFTVEDLQRLFAHLEGMGERDFDAERFIEEKSVQLRQVILRSRRLLAMLEQTRRVLSAGPLGRRAVWVAKPPKKPRP